MDEELPHLVPSGWSGGKFLIQGLLNINRNTVTVYSPFKTLMASFVERRWASLSFWINQFEEVIKESWTVVMVAGPGSDGACDGDGGFPIDVKKNDESILTYKDAHEFGNLVIKALSGSDITPYADHILIIKDSI